MGDDTTKQNPVTDPTAVVPGAPVTTPMPPVTTPTEPTVGPAMPADPMATPVASEEPETVVPPTVPTEGTGTGGGQTGTV